MFNLILQRALEDTPNGEDGKKDIVLIIFNTYKLTVTDKHPDKLNYWPVVTGHNVQVGTYNDYFIVILKHSGNCSFKTTNGIQINPNQFGSSITPQNINDVRNKIERFYLLTEYDSIFIVKNDLSNLESEIEENLKRHYKAMNLLPMKVFLSHKSVNKPKVREFKKTLQLLGFEPWLDEDNMHAGVELERALLQGMKDSCAAVFFITSAYTDENYLADEINYARQQKRSNPNFQIITLVLQEEDGKQGVIPDLLTPYVWKNPQSDLEALQEIIKALPIKVGNIGFR